MKWVDIKKKFPDKFILLTDMEEEKISTTECRILGGKVLEASDDLKTIMESYQRYKESGKNAIYSLPSTPEDFVIENVPFMGILR